MLFLTYWELNENMSAEDRHKIATKLVESGLFPPKDVNILRWDATPDGWGISLVEAESAAAFFDSLNIWRAAGAGMFKLTKASPAMPVQELMGQMDQLLKKFSQSQEEQV